MKRSSCSSACCRSRAQQRAESFRPRGDLTPCPVAMLSARPCARAGLAGPPGGLANASLVAAIRVSNACGRCSGRPALPSEGSGGYCNEGHRRTRATAEVAGSCPSRGRAAQHHPDPRPTCCSAPRRRAEAESDRPRHRGDGDPARRNRRRRRRPRCRRTPSTTSSASCPDGSQVVLEATATAQMLLRSGRSRFTLQTLPESDFPDLAAGDMAHSFVAAGRPTFKRLIDRTQFAISTEETRYYLNGIYLHAIGPPRRRCCARLRPTATAWPASTPPLPSGRARHARRDRAAQDRRRSAEAARGRRRRGQVELSDGKIRFTSADVVLTSKLIDGTFPDYGASFRRTTTRN
jgi:hypothetical protein